MSTPRRAAAGGEPLTAHHRVPARARRLRALVAGGVVAGTILLGAGSAPAAVGSFDGSASAAGARMIFFADKAPATKTPIDGGGPVAQAVLDSLGTSTALASNPYPGDVFLAGPGLAAGAFGAPSLPGYPFMARAEHPVTPKQTASTPFGDFAASAEESAAKATATTGGGSADVAVGRAISDAAVRIDGDLVISEAKSTAQAVKIGALRIGGVRSSARVVLKPDGTLERTAEVAFDNATVAGAPVAFTRDGVVPASGVTPPAGATPADQLKDSGIEVVQLDREDTPDGVVAGGLQITRVQDFGPGGPGYIRVVFGQAAARARGEATVLEPPARSTTGQAASTSAGRGRTNVALSAPVTPDTGIVVATAEANGSPAPTGAVTSGAAASGERSGAGRASSAVTSPPIAEGAVAASPEYASAVAARAPDRAVVLTARPARSAIPDANRLDVAPIYAVVLLAAAVGGGAIQLVRFFAGR